MIDMQSQPIQADWETQSYLQILNANKLELNWISL